MKLKIICSTVREGRKGMIVTRWIESVARAHSGFQIEVVDLKEVNLPLMDEPNHPSKKEYIHEHTRRWSAQIDEADAFIFVTAEYDYNYPAPLRNALEFLFQEWGYKAAGIVSYGGVSAGTRAANSLKNDLASLRMVALLEAVHIPFFSNMIEGDTLKANDIMVDSANKMLTELARWTSALMPLRQPGK